MHMGVCAYGCVCIWMCMHRVYVQWWLGVYMHKYMNCVYAYPSCVYAYGVVCA